MLVEPMTGRYGATVRNVALNTIDAAGIEDLRQALARHRVLLIRDQQLDGDAYIRFGRQLGRPKIYVDARKRDEQFPEITLIHNRESTPGELRNSAQNWHSDASYDALPMAMTMLYAIEMPREGGETLFCDMAGSYAGLPEELRRKVDGRFAKHSPEGDRRLLMNGEERGDLGQPQDPVWHPLVIRHPVNGQPVLYAVSGSPYEVEGLSDEEGIELLKTLKTHCTRDEFVMGVKGEPGDLLLWDNFSVMHAATPAHYSDRDGERRMLHRITILADRAPEPWREAVLA